jgi:hypothetical protein
MVVFPHVELKLNCLDQSAEPDTGGGILCIQRILKIFQTAKQAHIYIPGVPPKAKCKETDVATTKEEEEEEEEEEDVLSLNEDAATTLAGDSPESKRVLIRNSRDRYKRDTERLLDISSTTEHTMLYRRSRRDQRRIR